MESRHGLGISWASGANRAAGFFGSTCGDRVMRAHECGCIVAHELNSARVRIDAIVRKIPLPVAAQTEWTLRS